MTALSVGRPWREATPEQRKRLMAEFRVLLVRTYANAFAAVREQSIKMRPFRGEGGENEVIVRSEVVQRYPTVQIIDSHYYGVDTFMLCEVNPYVLITQQVYADIHPNLVTIPLAGDYDMPYGLMYAKSPSAATKQFLEASKKQR